MNQLAPVRGALAPLPPPQINQETEAFIVSIGSREVARPRDHEKVLSELRLLASVGADTLYYSIPVKNKDGTATNIEGPSIKMANMLLSVYGNCGVDVKVTETSDAWIFAATFVDAEKGHVLRRLYRQRKGQQSLKTDAGRQEDIAFQIGQSKAIRNVVVNALSIYCDFAMDHARQGLIEKVKKFPGPYYDRILRRLKELNVDPMRVARWVGHGVDEWKQRPDVMAQIIAALQGINEGIAKPDEVWPAEKPAVPSAPPPPPPSAANGAQQNAAPAAPAAEPEAPQGEPVEAEAPKQKTAPKKPTPATKKEEPEPAQETGPLSADDLAKAFAAASDQQAIDVLWARHEMAIGDMPEDQQAKVIAAYEAAVERINK